MAGQELLKVSKDEIERARLLSEYKYEMDLQSKMVTAKREGQEEERQKLLDNARKALAEGVPVEYVQKVSGLDMETITKLFP